MSTVPNSHVYITSISAQNLFIERNIIELYYTTSEILAGFFLFIDTV